VVLTFDPHPLSVLRPAACPRLLSTLADRMQLLGDTGAVDHCVVLHFDHARSLQRAEDFVRHALLPLGLRELIVGRNFACGHGREGSIDYLSALGAGLGFDVLPVELDAVPGTQDAVRSSSTEARRLIQAGDLAAAYSLLQRAHEMTGTVMPRPSASRRTVQAALASAMCAPATADYVGAIRRSGAAHWRPALLRVRDDPVSRHRVVRFDVDEEIDAITGDEVRLRFLDRARAFAQERAHP
jgi:riboflavin kinase/FMN adenylyltransferase